MPQLWFYYATCVTYSISFLSIVFLAIFESLSVFKRWKTQKQKKIRLTWILTIISIIFYVHPSMAGAQVRIGSLITSSYKHLCEPVWQATITWIWAKSKSILKKSKSNPI